jgi:hypothetical protein
MHGNLKIFGSLLVATIAPRAHQARPLRTQTQTYQRFDDRSAFGVAPAQVAQVKVARVAAEARDVAGGAILPHAPAGAVFGAVAVPQRGLGRARHGVRVQRGELRLRECEFWVCVRVREKEREKIIVSKLERKKEWKRDRGIKKYK